MLYRFYRNVRKNQDQALPLRDNVLFYRKNSCLNRDVANIKCSFIKE